MVFMPVALPQRPGVSLLAAAGVMAATLGTIKYTACNAEQQQYCARRIALILCVCVS